MFCVMMKMSAYVPTTDVALTGLSTGGLCGPSSRWVSSTASRLRWPSAILYRPAQRSTANERPEMTRCSQLCDPDPELDRERWRVLDLERTTHTSLLWYHQFQFSFMALFMNAGAHYYLFCSILIFTIVNCFIPRSCIPLYILNDTTVFTTVIKYSKYTLVKYTI